MLLFTTLKLIFASESYLGNLMKYTENAVQTKYYTFFNIDNSPCITYTDNSKYQNIKSLYAEMVDKNEKFFLKNILQVKEDCTLYSPNDVMGTFMFEPVMCGIYNINDDNEYVSVVTETYLFLIYMVKVYKVVPILDMHSIFPTDDGTKFLLKDYLIVEADRESILKYFLELKKQFLTFDLFKSEDRNNEFTCITDKMTKFLVNALDNKGSTIFVCKGFKRRIRLPVNTEIHIETDNIDDYLKLYDFSEEIINKNKDSVYFLSILGDTCILYAKLNNTVVEFSKDDISDVLRYFNLKIDFKAN